MHHKTVDNLELTMLSKVLAVCFCFFIAGTVAISVNHLPLDYYEREVYVVVMALSMLSGMMIYWVADFIISD